MTEPKQIRVPTIINDPMVGRLIISIPLRDRLISPPLGFFTDYIIIDNEKLEYRGSKISFKARKSFYLKSISKFLVRKWSLSCWTKDHKLDFYGRLGTDIVLYLVDTDGEKHELIPRFMMNAAKRGKKDWDRFLFELCGYSGLPLEEEAASATQA